MGRTSSIRRKEGPFFVVFGRDQIEPSDIKPPNRYRLGDDVWDDFNWNWHRANEVSKKNLKKKQQNQKRRYDATAKPISFEVGDSVLYITALQKALLGIKPQCVLISLSLCNPNSSNTLSSASPLCQ
jgi:hypothetical protein